MPTPVEHYEAAETYLEHANGATDPLAAARMVTRAGVHATLASVPWAVDDRGDVELAQGLSVADVAGLVEVLLELRRWASSPTSVPVMPTEDVEAYVNALEGAKRNVGDLLEHVGDLLTEQAARA